MNIVRERDAKIKALSAQIVALSAGKDGIRSALTERDAKVGAAKQCIYPVFDLLPSPQVQALEGQLSDIQEEMTWVFHIQLVMHGWFAT